MQHFAAAEADLAHAVLLSEDLFTQALWPWLDADSKAALRSMSKHMRSLVDGSITRVASSRQGFVAGDLTIALLTWPAVRHLTLLNVGSAADLASLSTASLAGLKNLTVRECLLTCEHAHCLLAPQADALVMSAFSNSVAATLRAIDISGCARFRSIDFIRSCAQLRCLWMPGCVNVSDLSALSACSETLEELWMARSRGALSLTPLKACTRLRKLDLRDCRSALRNQVEGLQQTCKQLATLQSVEIEGLVHELQPNILPDRQTAATAALAKMVHSNADRYKVQDAIAAAGAIPALVHLLLEPESLADVLREAAGALADMAAGHAQNRATITAAGAIPLLVQLLGPESSAGVQQEAARALFDLAARHAQNQGTINDAGAVPALLKLLRPESSANVRGGSSGGIVQPG
ncbi:hypothetical protein FOA52_005275 [Chlamydomonas sp. UWO 241]|nr:hypothetical protein FOA52_005275 [Chlamydomonas sp. UWO 241]